MPKFRHHKVKREHHVLAAIEDGLARIAELPEVQSVIPGPITRKAGRAIGFTLQYPTPTGLKLIGRSPGAAQEVFVVTSQPDAVVAQLITLKVLKAPTRSPDTP